MQCTGMKSFLELYAGRESTILKQLPWFTFLNVPARNTHLCLRCPKFRLLFSDASWFKNAAGNSTPSYKQFSIQFLHACFLSIAPKIRCSYHCLLLIWHSHHVNSFRRPAKIFILLPEEWRWDRDGWLIILRIMKNWLWHWKPLSILRHAKDA